MASHYAAGSQNRGVPYGPACLLVGLALALASITDRTAGAQEKKGSPPPVDPERLEQVRELLSLQKVKALQKLGSTVNDVYFAILKDQKSELFEDSASLVLYLLADQKGDRSQFLPVARKIVSHKEGAIRSTAARLLGEIGGPADAPLLTPLLTDESDWVKTDAAAALAKIGTPKELDAFDQLLSTQYPDDRDTVLVQLFRSRDQLRKRLEAQKRIPPEKKAELPVDPAELKRVWELLRRHRNPPEELEKAGPVLNAVYLVILEDPRAGPRECAGILWLLNRQKGDRTRFAPAVGRLLRDPGLYTRAAAAELLGDIGGAADASLLVPLLSDEYGLVQQQAASAVAKIGTAAELDVLDRRLKTKHPENSTEVLAELTKCRDQLKARLDSRKKPKE